MVLVFILAVGADAQPFYGVTYRPSGVKYDVLETTHFHIIFQRGFDSLAARVGAVAEDAYPGVEKLAGLEKPLRLPIILNGYNDASNGFVSPLPFRMEIDASPIEGKILNPRHQDWISQVVPHELTHAAEAEIRGGPGIGDFVRFFSPDWARSINFGAPRGLSEGLAVSYESKGPNAVGRRNFSFSHMQVRAAADTKPWNLSQVLDPPGYTRPFDRYYTGGAELVAYLTDSVRTDFLVSTARFYNRWPILGFGIALWQSSHLPPWVLSRRFAAYSRNTFRPERGGTSSSSTRLLTDVNGLACRRPRWRDDKTLIAYCSGYNIDPGLYQIDANSGSRTLLSRHVLTEDHFMSLDAGRDEILFAEYRPIPFTRDGLRSRVVRLGLGSRRAATVEGSERLRAPVRLSDGSVLALNDAVPVETLVRLEASGISRNLFGRPGVRIQEVRVGASGKLVALVNQGGRQGLYSGWLDGAGLHGFRPLISPRRGSIYDPDWLPDGGGIVFCADPDGTPNVYRVDAVTGTVGRLTDAAFGAFEPSVSPDGRTLAFVHYEHEQYQIAVKPFPDQEAPADSLFSFGSAGEPSLPTVTEKSSGADMTGDPRPYRPFPAFLRPRSLLPVIRFKEPRFSDQDRRLGPGFGASVSGTDALAQWAYSLHGFYQANRLWGAMTLQTGNNVLRPFLTVSDRPRSSILSINGRTARVPYEERAVEVGGALPLRLTSGASSSSLAAGASVKYRGIRLLDSDGGVLSKFDDRITLDPFLAFGYRVASNPRDIIPNSGVVVVTSTEVDVRTEDVVVPGRSWRTDGSIYLPVFNETSRRARALFGVLWRNRGSGVDTDTFLPRGYETEDVFLSGGTFLKGGLELVQPISWVDRGLVLFPLSLQAIYLYSFIETIGRSLSWYDARSSAGAGMGFRLLIAHHLGVDLRIGVARLLEENEWAVTFR